MRLFVSSPSSHNVNLLSCSVLSVLALVELLRMALFWDAFKINTVSFLIFHFGHESIFHLQFWPVFTLEESLQFSPHFVFSTFSYFLFVMMLSAMLMVAIINLFLLFLKYFLIWQLKKTTVVSLSHFSLWASHMSKCQIEFLYTVCIFLSCESGSPILNTFLQISWFHPFKNVLYFPVILGNCSPSSFRKIIIKCHHY